jgi:hypothetical protein
MKLNAGIFPNRIVGTHTPLTWVENRDEFALGEHSLFNQNRVEEEVICPFGWWFYLAMRHHYSMCSFVWNAIHDIAASPPPDRETEQNLTTNKTPQNVSKKQKSIKQDSLSVYGSRRQVG